LIEMNLKTEVAQKEILPLVETRRKGIL